jgi:hypothetical protein
MLKEACLIEPGAMTDERIGKDGSKTWKNKIVDHPALYSYVMNNYWHTNFKSDQEGKATFQYALVPHGSFDRTAAEKNGLDYVRPLIMLPANEKQPIATTLFVLSHPSVVVTSIKKEAQTLKIRIFNTSTAPVDFKFIWGSLKPEEIRVVTSYDEWMDLDPGEIIEIGGLGILEVVIGNRE